MRAHASARVELVDGRTRLIDLRSEPPIVLRPTARALYLVGGAAGPLGGDVFVLNVDVGCGAELAVRSAAATLAQPGPSSSPSRTAMQFVLADGASLDWQPQPLISVRGSDHLVETTVSLSPSSRLHLADELVLGRAGEAPGRIRLRCRVERGGVPLLAHDLDLGCGSPMWDGAGVMGDARALVSTLRVGPDAPKVACATADEEHGSRAAWLPLAPDAALLLAIGPTLIDARRTARSLGVLHPYTGEEHQQNGMGDR